MRFLGGREWFVGWPLHMLYYCTMWVYPITVNLTLESLDKLGHEFLVEFGPQEIIDKLARLFLLVHSLVLENEIVVPPLLDRKRPRNGRVQPR